MRQHADAPKPSERPDRLGVGRRRRAGLERRLRVHEAAHDEGIATRPEVDRIRPNPAYPTLTWPRHPAPYSSALPDPDVPLRSLIYGPTGSRCSPSCRSRPCSRWTSGRCASGGEMDRTGGTSEGTASARLRAGIALSVVLTRNTD